MLGPTLSACSGPGAANMAAAALAEREGEMPRRQALNGWGPFTFGMGFEEAVNAFPAVVWDPRSLRSCRDAISHTACTLTAADGSPVPPTAGIPLLPSIVFNQAGKLAAIRLGHFLRGVEPAQCERPYRQLLDSLRETWGAPTAPPSSSIERGASDSAVVGRETFHAQPDGRRITLLARHIRATNAAPAVCHLGIHYRGPEILQPPRDERPNPLKNWY